MSEQFDVVVIGSGFGGSVSACRLAQKGHKVLILERGRRWKPEDYPREAGDGWVYENLMPQHFNGWADIDFFPNMAVARGAGVGGGSLIYASVSIVPPAEIFDHGWPSAIKYEDLQPHYATVGKMLNVQKIPDNQLTERYRVMRDGAEALGMGDRFHGVELAVNFDPEWSYEQDDCFNDDKSKTFTNPQGVQQGTCVHCANCDAGCQVKAKNTLDMNYIPLAEQHGAEVRPLHIVTRIEPVDGGYKVSYDRLADGQRHPGSVIGKRVVLAAGSLGSTELLLHARDNHKTLPNLSPRLGHGWSCNGDFVTPSVHGEREISATQGPTISSAIDLLDGKYKGAKLFIEDGGFPDLVGNYLEEMLKHWDKPSDNPLQRLVRGVMGRLRFPYHDQLQVLAEEVRQRNTLSHVMFWFGQAVDGGDGRFYLHRPWYAPWRKEMTLEWNIERSEKTMDAMAELHRELSKATCGTPFVPPTWTLGKDLITPHPLGGCGMGEDINTGVVDHKGEVFGYPGLFVLDGSIVPTPLGLNPSRTIAALAERACTFID